MDSVSLASSGKKARPPVALASCAQRGARFFHGAAVVLDIVVAEHAHGVNHGIVPLRLLDGIFQAVPAGIVLAVGHDQDHFLVARAFLQVIERTDHGVIQRRAAARVNAFERRFHFVQVAREVVLGIEVVVVVEIDDEAFILRIGSLDERERRRVHLRAACPACFRCCPPPGRS